MQYFCQFTLLDFYIIPGTFRCLPDGFPYLPGGKFTPRSHPVKFFENLTFSPVIQAGPTGVLRQRVLSIFISEEVK